MAKSKKIDYSKRLKPIYIESIEANHIYINDYAKKADKKIEYKIGNSWFEFQKIKTRKAVITDSLFLRYMESSITRFTRKFKTIFACLRRKIKKVKLLRESQYILKC